MLDEKNQREIQVFRVRKFSKHCITRLMMLQIYLRRLQIPRPQEETKGNLLRPTLGLFQSSQIFLRR